MNTQSVSSSTCRQCVAPPGPCATCMAGPRAGRWPPAPPRRGRLPAHPANRGRWAAPAHRCAACRGSTRPPGPLHIQDLINKIKRQKDYFYCCKVLNFLKDLSRFRAVLRIRILLSSRKNCKKNPDSYCFFYFNHFSPLKNDVKVASKSKKQKN